MRQHLINLIAGGAYERLKRNGGDVPSFDGLHYEVDEVCEFKLKPALLEEVTDTVLRMMQAEGRAVAGLPMVN